MTSFFQTFSWRALWTPELIIILAVTAALYIFLIYKWKSSFLDGKDVPLQQKIYFALALMALYIGWGSPLYVAGHMVLSIHMTQMVFSYFIAVPLFLLALPKWFLHSIIYRWEKRSAWSYAIVFHPVIGLIGFNALFSFYHIPMVFDYLMQSVGLHSLYEMALLATAALMWWHMLAPIPAKTQWSDFRRIAYIFGNGILITPACALIIFSGEAIYHTYTDPNTWANVMAYCLPPGSTVPLEMFYWTDQVGSFSSKTDQQLGGVIMKVMQEVTYGFTVGYVFKQWLKKEKQQDGELTINDVPTSTNSIKGR